MPPERDYLDKKFQIGNTDTAALFLFQAKRLLNSCGTTGFIIPKAFTYASNWKKARNILLADIIAIADCGKVWSGVKLEMSICLNQKNNKRDSFMYYKRNNETIEKFGINKRNLCAEFDLILNGVTNAETDIALKMKRNNKTLNDFTDNSRGAMLQDRVEKEGDMSALGGKQIGKYFINTEKVKGKIKVQYVKNTKAEPKPNSILVQNIIAHIIRPVPRIVITAALNNIAQPSKFIILDTINQLVSTSGLHPNFILGVVNAKLISWYAYRFIFANAIRTMHFDSATTEKIPFPHINLSKKSDKKAHDTLVSLVDKMLELKRKEAREPNPDVKKIIFRQIDGADKAIDAAVYALYGLTKDEIKTVEEN